MRDYGITGLFTQPHALTGNMGDPRTMTAYNYAGADPINSQDASGYCSRATNSPRGYTSSDAETSPGTAAPIGDNRG